MAKKTISSEYQEQLLSVRQGTSKDWGTTGARNAGAPIAEIVRRSGIAQPTLLDYGAGEGTLRRYLEGEIHSLRINEYDPCIPELQKMPDGNYDFVVSSDVLEHVERDCIEAVIDECFDKATFGVYHHIATCLTGRKLPDGRDFHILVRNHQWWKSMLDRAGWTLMEHSAHCRLQRGEYKTSSRFYFEKG